MTRVHQSVGGRTADELGDSAACYQALLLHSDGSVTHLPPSETLQTAQQAADARDRSVDAQVLALRPRRVAASREAGSTWRLN